MSLSELYEIADSITFDEDENRALEQKLRKAERDFESASCMKPTTEEFLTRSYSL